MKTTAIEKELRQIFPNLVRGIKIPPLSISKVYAGVTKEFSAESVLCCLLVDCEEAKSYLAALVVHAFVYNICYRTVTFICRVRWLHDVQHSRH